MASVSVSYCYVTSKHTKTISVADFFSRKSIYLAQTSPGQIYASVDLRWIVLFMHQELAGDELI